MLVTMDVTVFEEGGQTSLTIRLSSDDLMAAVLRLVCDQLKRGLNPLKWQAVHRGRPLQWHETVAQAIPECENRARITLELRPLAPTKSGQKRAAALPTPPPPAASAPSGAPPFALPDAFEDDDDFELTLEAEPAESPVLMTRAAPAPAQRSKPSADEAKTVALEADSSEAAPPSQRVATVRYYHRMNPLRLFPLLVVVAKKEIENVRKRAVSQAAGERFDVKEEMPIVVEPILPGCACYPPQQEASVKGDAKLTFWVVPNVLGKLQSTRVVIRQDGAVLSEVPLAMRVKKQTWTVVMGVLACLLPFLSAVLQRYKLDFGTQMQQGFPLYAQVGHFLFRSLQPELLGGALVLLTLALYLWNRPRKRDVFWDVKLKS